MESFFIRYRNLIVLLTVLLAQIVGLGLQVRRTEGGRGSLDVNDGSGVRLIRYWAESVVSPPQRMLHGSKLGAIGLWGNYIDLIHTRQENKDLQQTIDRLRLEQAELLEDAQQGQRLQAMLGFKEHYVYSTVPAQIYGASGSVQSNLFYIDKGSADGLKRDMPVISPDGIVGKVRDVLGNHTAQVLAINDQTSGAGVILETTRIRGVLKGDAAGHLMIVGLMADQRIKPGEKVVTAGGDLIFPRGLPVGTVQKIAPDPDRDSFIRVFITPAAHLDRLDEVLVITSSETSFPAQDQKDMAISEQEKGAQAAAIAEQMKASQIMAERLPGLNDPNTPASTQPNGASQPNAASKPNAAAQNGANQNGTSQNGRTTPAAAPPAPKLLPTLHTDRFSPNAASGYASTAPATGADAASKPTHAPVGQSTSGSTSGGQKPVGPKSAQPATSQPTSHATGQAQATSPTGPGRNP